MSCVRSLTGKPHEQMQPKEGLLLAKSSQGLQTPHSLNRNAYKEARWIYAWCQNRPSFEKNPRETYSTIFLEY